MVKREYITYIWCDNWCYVRIIFITCKFTISRPLRHMFEMISKWLLLKLPATTIPEVKDLYCFFTVSLNLYVIQAWLHIWGTGKGTWCESAYAHYLCGEWERHLCICGFPSLGNFNCSLREAETLVQRTMKHIPPPTHFFGFGSLDRALLVKWHCLPAEAIKIFSNLNAIQICKPI